MTSTLELWAAQRTDWLIVDQMLCGWKTEHVDCGRYSTHYICGHCIRDLSSLYTPHVVACPYCATPLPPLQDLRDQEHIQCHGEWPYDLLTSRNRPGGSWCSWYSAEGQPMTIREDGTRSWPMVKCRRIEGHDGEHRYSGAHEMPPRSPFDTRREADACA